ncbi:MAG: hydrogenase maturation nickel metallochaperone HypA [Deltaproteobacteria bacterium]|nr:hydrogenase maturation nickel metallochaperone HypA [Deltaproteobacteria bacterium]MBI4796145.1 hydrogenase maturation nickel metallochaperone HypA [Deltaproteobacteria bacterium]
MHEYGLMEEVVKSLLAKLDEPGIVTEGAEMEVVLKVGALAVHSAAATRQAYEVLVKGTKLEKSRLTLIIEPLILTCSGCGFSGPLPEGAVDPHEQLPLAPCPQCGSISPVAGSRGVESIELVLD